MEIKGKLVKVLPPVTGQGRNGEWKRQEFVIELDGTYPRKVCISTWGDKVNVEALPEGSVLNVFYDLESREYMGKWYTSVTAWKVEIVEEGSPQQQPVSAEQSPFDQPPQSFEVGSEEEEPKDDLPF